MKEGGTADILLLGFRVKGFLMMYVQLISPTAWMLLVWRQFNDQAYFYAHFLRERSCRLSNPPPITLTEE